MSAFVTGYPDVVRAVVPDLRVSSGEFQDFDFLLGMDVISQGDFHLTNNGHSKIVFRIPPEA